MSLYVKTFKDARILEMSTMSARFELLGREFLALNAHPHQPFTEAISFFIEVEHQDEVDYYWNALTADGGKESMRGWLTDKFGVSWQVIPKRSAAISATKIGRERSVSFKQCSR